jgi:transcription elongation factor Elf1
MYSVGVEHRFLCPYCGEEISMILDASVRRQTYIEDCEVCCRPIEISYAFENGELSSFSAGPIE